MRALLFVMVVGACGGSAEPSRLTPESMIATVGEQVIRYEDISCALIRRTSPDCRIGELQMLRLKLRRELVDIAIVRLDLALTDEVLENIAAEADRPLAQEARQQSARLFRCAAERALLLHEGKPLSDAPPTTDCSDEDIRRVAEGSTTEQLKSIVSKDLVAEMRQSLFDSYRYAALGDRIRAILGSDYRSFWAELVDQEVTFHYSEYKISQEDLLP